MSDTKTQRGRLSSADVHQTGPIFPKLRKRSSVRVRTSLAIALMNMSFIPGCVSMQASEPAETGASSAEARLMSRFPEPWSEESTYMISTVQTPQGLWNVYVVSIPPNQVAIRQSRQDGEYEFGLVDDLIWHVAFGKSKPTVLGSDWGWFIRNHEIYRFSEWLQSLEFVKSSSESTHQDCTRLQATDSFDLAVTLCVDELGDPVWIERVTPASYGDQTVRIEFDEWSEYKGRRIPKKFRQTRNSSEFHWEIQGLLDVPAHERVEPPPDLELP